MREMLAILLVPFVVIGLFKVNDHYVCKEAKDKNKPVPAFCNKK